MNARIRTKRLSPQELLLRIVDKIKVKKRNKLLIMATGKQETSSHTMNDLGGFNPWQ
jgi:hypothetical protein